MTVSRPSSDYSCCHRNVSDWLVACAGRWRQQAHLAGPDGWGERDGRTCAFHVFSFKWVICSSCDLTSRRRRRRGSLSSTAVRTALLAFLDPNPFPGP